MKKKFVFYSGLSVAVSVGVGLFFFLTVNYSDVSWYLEVSSNSGFLLSPFVLVGVWCLIYFFSAISLIFVLSKGFYHKWVQIAVYHYAFQLMLSMLWWMLFFGNKSFVFSSIVALLYIVLLRYTIKYFRVVTKKRVPLVLMLLNLIWAVYVQVLNLYFL